MKNLFFAALAASTLSVAVVPAYAHDVHNGSSVIDVLAYAHDFHNGSSAIDLLSATQRAQTGSYGG